MIDKNLVLINYLKEHANDLGIEGFKIKSEYSLNDNNMNVMVVQMANGEKQVLFDNMKIYDYFIIQIFGDSIRTEKNVAVSLGELIGCNEITKYNNEDYQVCFMQFSNPQTIMYDDIQRVGYTLTIKTIISKI